MKPVILSADGPEGVYMVPDAVAENLNVYCMEFCTKWLRKSPDAAKYRRCGLCYNEADFIDYLNTWIFPEQPSYLIQDLEDVRNKELPPEYRDVPSFNF